MLYRFQRQASPRLFFGALFPAEKCFDYFVRVDEHPHLGESDVCAICYSEFRQDSKPEPAHDIPELSDTMSEYLNSNWHKIMRTPCNHFFHSSCLLTVMNYKPSCPICRTTLPPIEGQ